MMTAILRWLRQNGVRVGVSIALVLLFIGHASRTIRLPLLNQLEYLAYDARLRFTMPGGVDRRIVIVDVDEKSLAAEGRWPWSRFKMATLVNHLFDDYGARVVGFDMVFAEPEESDFLSHLHEYAGIIDDRNLQRLADQLRTRLNPDLQFARSLKDRATVLGFYFSNQDRTVGMLPEPILPTEINAIQPIPAPHARGYGANLEILQRNAMSGGNFDNPAADEDGVFRRAPVLTDYQGAIYGSLSFNVAQAYLKGTFRNHKHNEWVAIGNHRIPVDGQMAALVPYRGAQGSFPYVSATDVLQRRLADPGLLKDAIVLVGTTAPGLYDLRSTPVQKEYAGVEIHANLIAGILDQRFLQRPAFTLAAELVQLTLVGLIMAMVVPLLGAGAATLVTLSLLALAVGGNLALWMKANTVLPLAPVIVLILVLFLFNAAHGFLVESSTRRHLKRLFGQYVPPELVDEMSHDPRSYSLAGERRSMTVLFSDVRGFTSISERLDPRDLSNLMNALLTPMTQIIHRNRGTIDKYMGDAIMAFWGAPVPEPDHARHAVIAALAMQAQMAEIRKEFPKQGWPEVYSGIGLATGEMNVGNMGSQFRMAYTVMGDAVNLGSRLEGLTKEYGVSIIVSEDTARLAPGFVYRELDRVRVKGRAQPVTIFEPIGAVETTPPERVDLVERHRQALEAYRAQDWDKAGNMFRQLLDQTGDTVLYELYLSRIIHFTEQPPIPDWDGVFSHTKK